MLQFIRTISLSSHWIIVCLSVITADAWLSSAGLYHHPVVKVKYCKFKMKCCSMKPCMSYRWVLDNLRNIIQAYAST